jgi:hypothetical protein
LFLEWNARGAAKPRQASDIKDGLRICAREKLVFKKAEKGLRVCVCRQLVLDNKSSSYKCKSYKRDKKNQSDSSV